jgi:tetratricopeptide (TPR) repeat protein
MRLAILAALLCLATAARAVGPDVSELEGDPGYRDAVTAVKTGDYRRAIGLLEELDRLHPRKPEILNWLGFSHRKLKDYPTSKRFYDLALTIHPDYRPALNYQGMWFIETGDIASARRNLARLVELCPVCEETKDLKDELEKLPK